MPSSSGFTPSRASGERGTRSVSFGVRPLPQTTSALGYRQLALDGKSVYWTDGGNAGSAPSIMRLTISMEVEMSAPRTGPKTPTGPGPSPAAGSRMPS